MESPFSNILQQVNNREGGGIAQNFDELTPEQKETARDMLGEAQAKDMYDSMVEINNAVNVLAKAFGGIESDDIEIDYNKSTGRSNWRVNRKLLEDLISGDILPVVTWEDRYKVLTVVITNETEQTVEWDKGYVRAVAATAE